MGYCIFCKRKFGIKLEKDCIHYDSINDYYIGDNGNISREIKLKPKNITFEIGLILTLNKGAKK